MKITRRQIRQIIKEASWGKTADYKEDGSYFSDVIIMSPNGDSVLVDGDETYIENVPQQLAFITSMASLTICLICFLVIFITSSIFHFQM